MENCSVFYNSVRNRSIWNTKFLNEINQNNIVSYNNICPTDKNKHFYKDKINEKIVYTTNFNNFINDLSNFVW